MELDNVFLPFSGYTDYKIYENYRNFCKKEGFKIQPNTQFISTFMDHLKTLPSYEHCEKIKITIGLAQKGAAIRINPFKNSYYYYSNSRCTKLQIQTDAKHEINSSNAESDNSRE